MKINQRKTGSDHKKTMIGTSYFWLVISKSLFVFKKSNASKLKHPCDPPIKLIAPNRTGNSMYNFPSHQKYSAAKIAINMKFALDTSPITY